MTRLNAEGETVSDDLGREEPGWRSTIAIVWLLGFLVFFYCLTPPNNPTYRRFQFWTEVPRVLLLTLDSIDPPDEIATPTSGWTYFPQRLDLLAVAAIILCGAWGLGSLCLRALRITWQPQWYERALFAFAMGLGALSLLTLFCGLLGWLSRGLIAGVMAIAFLAECVLYLLGRRQQPEIDATDTATIPDTRPLSVKVCHLAWYGLPLAPFLLAMLLGSMLPSVDFDVREYHLQGPKEYFEAGRITFLPHNVYTSFPFLTEMLSLLAMVLRGDWFRGALAGKAVLMCFGPLTGLAIYIAGRRWFSPKVGYIAALVYLTMPWTFRISTIAYAEGGLTFYLFVSLLAFGIAIEQLRTGTNRAGRSFLLCGLLAGCAMACKYTGLISVVVPLLAACCIAPFCLTLPAELTRRTAVRCCGFFLIGTTVTIGPWLMKNVCETGNPVYPLMYTLFGGRDWDAELNAKWRAGHSPPNYTDLPERLLEVTAGNDWLSPLLFGLAPMSFLLWRRRASIRFLWLYVLWLFATWWVLTHRIDRFWVPMTPVIALLAGIGAAAVRQTFWPIVCRIGIVAALMFNLAFIVYGAAGYSSFLVDLDLRRARRMPPGIEYLNRTLPGDSRVLMVGEAQVFDAEFPLIYNSVFDYSIFEQWSVADQPSVPREKVPLRDVDEIRQQFRENSVTHVFVNWEEVMRYRRTYGYTKFVFPERFDELRRIGILNAPTTLVVLLDDSLSDSESEGDAQFQPLRLARSDGEEILVYGVREGLNAATRKQLTGWGSKLLIDVEGKRLFVVGQVFSVVRNSE